MTRPENDPNDIIMICCSDIAGQVRGKGMPVGQFEDRLATGVGWTPTNLMITALGPIADSPWGPFGDLFLRPDPATRVEIDADGSGRYDRFVLSDICHTDGSEWPCSPRSFLKRGLQALESEFGLSVKGAFEHEFHYDGAAEYDGSPYNLEAFRRQGCFGDVLMRALAAAGLEPDTFMPEYGPGQFEVTVNPATGVTIADQAVILREVTRTTATRLGHRASFTPIIRPEAVGNGVHVHFSLQDAAKGTPVNYDPARPGTLSLQAERFLAGVLARMPAMTALTAPSTISYLRLVPNRWSASWNNLGLNNREAGVRICPVFETSRRNRAQQFHFEYRAADAAASPYMVLGAIVWAGLGGLRDDTMATPVVTEDDPEQMSDDERKRCRVRRLPQSLGEALALLRDDADIKAWMGPVFHDAYLRHKGFENEMMLEHEPAEQCARYHQVY